VFIQKLTLRGPLRQRVCQVQNMSMSPPLPLWNWLIWFPQWKDSYRSAILVTTTTVTAKIVVIETLIDLDCVKLYIPAPLYFCLIVSNICCVYTDIPWFSLSFNYMFLSSKNQILCVGFKLYFIFHISSHGMGLRVIIS